jgi:paraquat-inducible protein A
MGANREPTHAGALIACDECDLVQGGVALHRGEVLHCRRCGAPLARGSLPTPTLVLALALSTAIFLLIACTMPVVSLEVRGALREATLLGAVRALYGDNSPLVGTIVLATLVVVPVVELTAVGALALHARRIERPRWFPWTYRILEALRPWNMAEVFLLGTIVALVKLAHLARVIPGVGLWAVAAVAILLATLGTVFESADVWAWTEGRGRS